MAFSFARSMTILRAPSSTRRLIEVSTVIRELPKLRRPEISTTVISGPTRRTFVSVIMKPPAILRILPRPEVGHSQNTEEIHGGGHLCREYQFLDPVIPWSSCAQPDLPSV